MLGLGEGVAGVKTVLPVVAEHETAGQEAEKRKTRGIGHSDPIK